jgi:pSer/pThr/pTyr-binding forkhead associated (FHA) protein
VHRVAINSGEPIALDVPIIVGRQPMPSRIPTSRPARLVTVPSPAREVSSTHLELRQHGQSVVVTDLRSTNGTVVAMPGSVPLTLRQGESVVVSVGAVVNIGDGNFVEILPIQRAAPPGTGALATGERLP